jgi:phosphatidylinositol glycan class W
MSLMDVGIGSFIISSALTSKYARGIYYHHLHMNVSRFLVLILGILRMIVLKVINYQEHVSEYGIHWNFFVTLFFIWLIADIVHHLCPRVAIPYISIAILLIYQYILSTTVLTDYMFSATRNNFFSSNREGIVSLFGCVPLYLLAESYSYYYFFKKAEEGNLKVPISLFSLIILILWYVSDSYIQQTSRRLMNLTYVLFVSSISSCIISILIYVHQMIVEDYRIITLEYINKAQLPLFLVANVATGLINLSIQTIYVSKEVAIFILSLYVSGCILFVWIFNSYVTREK